MCNCGSIEGVHLVYECRLKAVDPDWEKVWRRAASESQREEK